LLSLEFTIIYFFIYLLIYFCNIGNDVSDSFKAGDFLTKCMTVSIWKRILQHGVNMSSIFFYHDLEIVLRLSVCRRMKCVYGICFIKAVWLDRFIAVKLRVDS